MILKPITLTEKQEKWLALHFKHTKNEEIAAKLGVSLRSVPRLARRRGLVKSPQFMKKCQTAAKEAAYRSNMANGTFPPKGFVIPNREKYRFKPGVSPSERLGEKKNQIRIEKAQQSRNATIRKEKARVAFGLPQKTRLHVVTQSRQRVNFRYALKKKGYIIEEESRTVTWDENTTRSRRMESRNQPWYKFKEISI